ncbi:MAG TPA: DUF1559 domain-containing protein [Chthoniobacteraceae bacterium]|nr:DUF1559 domain-containing protein [Chthoniobacteraceae bacterium]
METPPFQKDRNAFTLTESLIVLGIIAVLAVLFFPLYQRAQQNSREIQCLANIKSYGTAVLAYASDHNGLPWWDGNGEASQTQGSTYPNYEVWVRPYLHQVAAMRLRCPLISAAQKEDNAFRNTFNYSGNSALNIYYPRFNSLPVPSPRVFLVAESYGTAGFNHSVHLNMTMWGISETAAYGPNEGLADATGIRKAQYHGGGAHRGLNIFFLDGHAALIHPARNDWREEPTYGTSANGGYFFERKQFQRMKANPLKF